jgi:hypothetical protein
LAEVRIGHLTEMTDSYAALSGFQHICRSFWLVCSVEYSVHVRFRTLLFPALQVNGPCGMSCYSMLTIPPLKNLLQGYRNVTATGGQRGLGRLRKNARTQVRIENWPPDEAGVEIPQRPFSAQCRSPQRV